MRHWFVKNVIDLLPQLEAAGVVSESKVEAPADANTAVVTFKGKDGSAYEIRASRGKTRVLGYDGGKRTWPAGQFECYDSLVHLLDAAGIASFEPAMANG